MVLDARDERWEEKGSKVVLQKKSGSAMSKRTVMNSTNDGVDVREAVLVEQGLDILGKEAIVCGEKVENV